MKIETSDLGFGTYVMKSALIVIEPESGMLV